jgi:hypothetical protein
MRAPRIVPVRRLLTAGCLMTLLGVPVAAADTPVTLTAPPPQLELVELTDADAQYRVTVTASSPVALLRWHVNVGYQGHWSCPRGAFDYENGSERVVCVRGAPAFIDYSLEAQTSKTLPCCGMGEWLIVLPRQNETAVYDVYAAWNAHHMFDPDWIDPYRGIQESQPSTVVVPARPSPAPDATPVGESAVTPRLQSPLKDEATRRHYIGAALACNVIAWGFDGVASNMALASRVITLANPVLGGQMAIAAGVFSVLKWASAGVGLYMGYLAYDPPDPNYKTPVKVKRMRLPKVRTGLVRLDRALNEVLRSQVHLIQYAKGLLTAIERAQGALNARDERWAIRQLASGGRHAREASAAVRVLRFALPDLARALPAQVRGSLRPALRRLTSGQPKPPPARARRLLRQLGINAADRALMRRMRDEAPVADVPRSIRKAIANPAALRTLRRTEFSFDRIASQMLGDADDLIYNGPFDNPSLAVNGTGARALAD